MPINVALLGSGLFVTGAYIPALVENKSDVNLHTFWSRSQSSVEKAAQKASESGLKPATFHGEDGLEKILTDKEIDAVLVVLPITKNPDLVIRALKAGKHVLSEKPVAKDVKDGRALVETYEKEYKPKGLIWRIAENFAHEPMLHYAAEVLRNPKLGPVLYWQLRSEGSVIDGSSWQSTEWRTIPDYQGGFLLDGGVHQIALLRTVLPTAPSTILSGASLHRAHLPPHDTVTAIALSHPDHHKPPHGPKTRLQGIIKESDIPSEIGKSAPHGTILLSFGAPNLPAEAKVQGGLVVTTVHAQVVIGESGGKWHVTVTGAKDSGVESGTKEGKSEGVMVEIGMFGRAVAAIKQGKSSGEENFGEPRGALWDVAVIEACLTSNGHAVHLDKLLYEK